MFCHASLSIILFFVISAPLVAQAPDAQPGEPPWVFLEASPLLLDQSIRSGQEYTTQGFSYGYDTRVMVNRQLGGRVAIQTGLGIGVWKLEQNSRYNEWWRDRYFPQLPPDREWFVRTYLGIAYVELPLNIRVEVLNIGTGALYLRGGTSWKIPIAQTVESYGVSENGGDPSRLPDEELGRKSTHMLNARLGYLVKEINGYRWYLELHFGGSTGTAFDQEAGGGNNREDIYLRSVRLREFGIVGGLGF